MPVSGKEASEIGRKYGLTIEQAAALKTLADSTDEAEELAAIYGDSDGSKSSSNISKVFDKRAEELGI